eukprot:tig00000248_g21843.t1
MTEDGMQLTPEQVNAFLDNSKTAASSAWPACPNLNAAHGKSFFLRDLMFNLSAPSRGIVISQTDRLNGDHAAQQVRRRAGGKEDPVDPRFFVLLDDVISDARLRYDEALNELFVAGRHYKIMTLITTQYAKGINPVLPLQY